MQFLICGNLNLTLILEYSEAFKIHITLKEKTVIEKSIASFNMRSNE